MNLLKKGPREEDNRSASDYADSTLARQLWDYRELFYFFAWRDIKIRYKQTALGVLWAIIQPLFTMVVFTVIFGRLAKIPSDGVPQPIFYFSALLPWIYFSSTLSTAGMSLVNNASLLTKIYFPRIILPAAAVLSGLLDFAIGSVVLGGFVIYYGYPLGWHLLLWPLSVVPLVLLAFGVGAFLSAVNVRYRDIKYAVPFGIQLWMFITPIIYPSSIVPDRFQWLLALNPLTGLIETFRFAVVPTQAPDLARVLLSLATTIVAAVLGVLYFKRKERAFADIV